MRPISLLLTLFVAVPAAADDKGRALIEKAIQAQGGPDKVAKLRAMRIKAEGTMELVPGQPATPFTIEDVWHMPDKYRTSATMTLMGMKVTQTQVLDGDKGWAAFNGRAMDLPKEAAAEMREQKYAEDLDRLGFLKDTGKELSVVEDARVNGKPAAGVRIKSKGHRDVTLYFDKDSGLLVKRTHPILDPMSGKEATQEVVFGDYADSAGVKYPKALTAFRDGKKVIEVKVTEVEFLDKVDPKLFAKP
jgi:hypothetical protein